MGGAALCVIGGLAAAVIMKWDPTYMTGIALGGSLAGVIGGSGFGYGVGAAMPKEMTTSGCETWMGRDGKPYIPSD
jgi:hypothetical protein